MVRERSGESVRCRQGRGQSEKGAGEKERQIDEEEEDGRTE